jgi:hypothetical protein
VSLIGCGTDGDAHPVGDLVGSITFEGKKMTGGLVVAKSPAGRTVKGPINDGMYFIKGVPAGPVKLAVDMPELPPELRMAGMRGAALPPLPPNIPPEAKGAMDMFLKIPPLYWEPDSSGLTATIKEGTNNVQNINLSK